MWGCVTIDSQRHRSHTNNSDRIRGHEKYIKHLQPYVIKNNHMRASVNTDRQRHVNHNKNSNRMRGLKRKLNIYHQFC